MASTRENLIAAKALIDTPEKWGKGTYEPSPGCYCALGALDAASEGGRWTPFEVMAALTIALPDSAKDIVAFNDDPNTTHADIMALFDRAIASQPQP